MARREAAATVPTAPTHHVRSANIMSQAHPTASAAPATAPESATARPSMSSARRTCASENPAARSTPICGTRCSMFNRKNSAESSNADTIRNALKYEKYAPKSVAPADAASL
jgi:hypothetical protein